MEDTQYIARLINKHLKEELSPEESAILKEWVNHDPEHLRYFEAIQSGDALISDLMLFDELWGAEGEDRMRRITRSVKSAAFPSQPAIAIKSNTYKLLKYVAAASLLFATVGIFFYLNSKKQSVTAVAFRYDVPPAKEQATIILASGKVIPLDSLSGQLAIGNRLISKAGGSVTYDNKDTSGITPEFSVLKTPRGGQYALVLADGSQAYLNSGSSIAYPSFFKGAVRKVMVTGEVFFTVAKAYGPSGKRIPFIIDVNGKQSIEVKGTEFNVDAYGPVIRTTVAEGRVQVTSPAGQLVLNKGQQAAANGSSLLLNNSPDLESIFAWRKGTFYFDAAPIDQIMEQVKNWYNVEVEYHNKPAGTFTVFSLSRKVPLSQLLTILAKTREVRFTIEGDAARNEPVKIIVDTPQQHQ